MEHLLREALLKFEEKTCEIKQLEYLRTHHANRRWPEIAPMRKQLDEIREAIIQFAMAPYSQTTSSTLEEAIDDEVYPFRSLDDH